MNTELIISMTEIRAKAGAKAHQRTIINDKKHYASKKRNAELSFVKNSYYPAWIPVYTCKGYIFTENNRLKRVYKRKTESKNMKYYAKARRKKFNSLCNKDDFDISQISNRAFLTSVRECEWKNF